jgi:hypothetical protein
MINNERFSIDQIVFQPAKLTIPRKSTSERSCLPGNNIKSNIHPAGKLQTMIIASVKTAFRKYTF